MYCGEYALTPMNKVTLMAVYLQTYYPEMNTQECTHIQTHKGHTLSIGAQSSNWLFIFTIVKLVTVNWCKRVL